MATLRIRPIPQAIAERLNDESAEIIQERLTAQGFTVSGVQIYNPPEPSPAVSMGVVTVGTQEPQEPALIIETNGATEAEVRAVLESWTPGITAERQTLRSAKNRLVTYRQTVEALGAQATPEQRALYDVTTLMMALAKRLDVG